MGKIPPDSFTSDVTKSAKKIKFLITHWVIVKNQSVGACMIVSHEAIFHFLSVVQPFWQKTVAAATMGAFEGLILPIMVLEDVLSFISIAAQHYNKDNMCLYLSQLHLLPV